MSTITLTNRTTGRTMLLSDAVMVTKYKGVAFTDVQDEISKRARMLMSEHGVPDIVEAQRILLNTDHDLYERYRRYASRPHSEIALSDKNRETVTFNERQVNNEQKIEFTFGR